MTECSSYWRPVLIFVQFSIDYIRGAQTFRYCQQLCIYIYELGAPVSS